MVTSYNFETQFPTGAARAEAVRINSSMMRTMCSATLSLLSHDNGSILHSNIQQPTLHQLEKERSHAVKIPLTGVGKLVAELGAMVTSYNFESKFPTGAARAEAVRVSMSRMGTTCSASLSFSPHSDLTLNSHSQQPTLHQLEKERSRAVKIALAGVGKLVAELGGAFETFTGFAISNTGLMATVAHGVCAKSENGSHYSLKNVFLSSFGGSGAILSPVQVLAVDTGTDVALIQIQLHTIPVEFQSGHFFKLGFETEVSKSVFTIGNPCGLSFSLCDGTVACPRRPYTEYPLPFVNPRGVPTEFYSIESTLKAGPGFSGGPLVDSMGYVVGVNQSSLNAVVFCLSHATPSIYVDELKRWYQNKGNADVFMHNDGDFGTIREQVDGINHNNALWHYREKKDDSDDDGVIQEQEEKKGDSDDENAMDESFG